jgi:hypothetical protein
MSSHATSTASQGSASTVLAAKVRSGSPSSWPSQPVRSTSVNQSPTCSPGCPRNRRPRLGRRSYRSHRDRPPRLHIAVRRRRGTGRRPRPRHARAPRRPRQSLGGRGHLQVRAPSPGRPMADRHADSRYSLADGRQRGPATGGCPQVGHARRGARGHLGRYAGVGSSTGEPSDAIASTARQVIAARGRE